MEEPEALRARPHWGRYPIPWVTYVRPDGTPDFRVHVEGRRRLVAEKRLCQLCGTRMGEEVTFIGFPHSLNGLRFGEPPAHRECLEYALSVCPWLSGRPYSDRPGDPGTHFVTRPEQPTQMVIYTCRLFVAVPDPSEETELVFLAGDADRRVEWFRRGLEGVTT